MISNRNLSEARSMCAVKANDLITKSRFSLTLEQQKVLLFMISKITPTSAPEDWFEIEVQDYCKLCGLSSNEHSPDEHPPKGHPPKGQYYNNIKMGLKNMADQSCWIEVSKGKQILFRWLDRLEINRNSGKIRYTFHSTVFPYLFDLKDKFTKIELIQTLTFSSKYTIRLYEYLKAFAFHAYKDGGLDFVPYEHEVSIEELKKVLDCEQYERFQDFRRFVLEVAEKEINSKTTDMRIAIYYEKSGRQIDRVVFEFQEIGLLDEMVTSSQRRRILNGEEHRNARN